MPILTWTPVQRGETPNAATLNGQYAPLTSALDAANVRQDAVARQHLAGAATLNRLFSHYAGSPSAPDTYSNTTWAQAVAGTSAVEVNLGTIHVPQYTVLRAHGSVLTAEHTVSNDLGDANYWGVRLVLDWSLDGTTINQRVVQAVGGSFTFRSLVTLETSSTGDRVNWTPMHFVGLVRCESTNEYWHKLRMEVIVRDGTNVLAIGGYGIIALVAEH